MSEPFREPPDDLADTFPWLPRGLYKRVKSDKGLARDIGKVAEVFERFSAHESLHKQQREKS